MTTAIPITLPGGLWVDGVCHRQAFLRPLSGADEEFLLDAGDGLLPAQKTTALLSRSVTQLGTLAPLTAEAARSLTVGDREALLLHLRRVTLGERLPCVVACPASGCGQKMDVDLTASELLLPPYRTEPAYERPIAVNGETRPIRFRLPTGADQEEAAAAARRDPPAAVKLLLERCVDGEGIERSIPEIAAQVGQAMSELDPQAELDISLTCPACGHSFSTLFDTASYFFQELAVRARHLYREVHLLALHYHWSEPEILSLTPRRRGLYLEMLSDALGREEGR